MRLLLLNPNTSRDVTALMRDTAAAAAAPGTEIVAATAPRGVPYIANRAEAQIGGAIALEMLAEAGPGIDAAILAAFGDPGLVGARELFDIPVIGLAEAAMLSACLLGGRFGIVTFAQGLLPWYRDCVAMHGLSARCAAIRAIEGRFASLAGVQAEKEDQLVALAEAAVREDGADVLIFAGAPLSGLGPRVRERVPVPVVDQVVAAVKLAEAAVALRPRKAASGALSRPPAKESRGLPEALAARLAHTDRG
ncbi:Asp/Glu/hydantoin racemase [Methylobacterium sp. 4-46]|uniref:aspartate/glutamate racemase family protein n=1 Tax=unclassified Methylobacterium TaxID=2615210 RepID=UPI000152CF2D|nr:MULTISPECIES: aspartate/glutamate racemase family protein [Methylobacterium]ACA15031.1 Asp/Glu/hydantoin racemase [Methylobacterium sp. 4-46]WFT80769.1 aspartate/glutamate racemase family protein [Methylobacterium nodulans]